MLMGIAVGSIGGGWLGALLSGNNLFSFLSVFLSIVGAAVGGWAGYKLAQYM
jgi:uncharacterized membrane protein YeaQ/YmgE (transglycosylase-associated protein family)